MSLKSLLNRIKSPKKDGKSPQGDSEKGYYIKVLNLEKLYKYELTSELTFGSEVGDVVIADETLSPRHGKFKLDNGIVSYIDLGSQQGSSINGNLIPKNRFIILDDNDRLLLGEVEVEVSHEDIDLELAQEVEMDKELASPPPPPLPVEEDRTKEVKLSDLQKAMEEDEPKETQDNLIEMPRPQEMKRSLSDSELTEEEFKVYEEEKNDDVTVSKILKEVSTDDQISLGEDTGKISQEGGTQFINLLKSKLVKSSKKDKTPQKRKELKSVDETPEKTVVGPISRVFSLFFDSLIVLSLMILASESQIGEDYYYTVKNIYADISQFLMASDWFTKLTTALKDVPALWAILKDLFQEGGGLGLFYFNLCLFRVLTSLVFGISLGALLCGVRSKGNILINHLGGAFREAIGFFTLPFILFDFPVLIGKRSFKEVITGTTLSQSSRLEVVIYPLLFTPLLVFGFLISPLFIGFKPNEKVILQQKVVKNEKSMATNYASRYYNFNIVLPENYQLLPRFSFSVEQGKQKLKIYHRIINLESQDYFDLELFKELNFKSIVANSLNQNIFIHEDFMTLLSYAKTSTLGQSAQRSVINEELANYIKFSFKLDINELIDNYQEYGLILYPLMNFRYGILKGIKYEDGLELIKANNEQFLVSHNLGLRPGTLFMPINVASNKVYQLSYPAKKVYLKENKSFFELQLTNANFSLNKKNKLSDQMNAFSVSDAVYFNSTKNKSWTKEEIQKAYGYYYLSAKVFLDKSPVLKKNYEKSLEEFISFSQKNEELSELTIRLKELKGRFETFDQDYFKELPGLKDSRTDMKEE